MRVAPTIMVLLLVTMVRSQEMMVAPSGTSSDRYVLQSAFEWAAMQAAQNPTIKLAPGATYYLNTTWSPGGPPASTAPHYLDTVPLLWLDDFVGFHPFGIQFESLTIDGQGATVVVTQRHDDGKPLRVFWFKELKPKSGPSRRVTFKNVTIRYEPRPFTQGTVDYVSSRTPNGRAFHTLILHPDAGYPDSSDDFFIDPTQGPTNRSHARTLLLFDAAGHLVPGTEQTEILWVEANGSSLRIETANVGSWTHVPATGDRFVLRAKVLGDGGRFEAPINFEDCDQPLVENVTVHHSGGTGIKFVRCGDVVVRNNRIEPYDEPGLVPALISVNRGGIRTSISHKTLFGTNSNIVTGNVIDSCCDDGLMTPGYAFEPVISTPMFLKLRKVQDKLFDIPLILAGKTVEIWNTSTLRLDAVGTIATANAVSDPIEVTLHSISYPNGVITTVDPAIHVVQLVEDMNPDSLFENNRVFLTRAHGMLIKSASTTIRNNVIEQTAAQAIRVGPDVYGIREGGFSSGLPFGLRVTGNRIIDCGFGAHPADHKSLAFGAIAVGVFSQRDIFPFPSNPGEAVADVLIHGNHIDRSGLAGISSMFTTGLTVTDNTILRWQSNTAHAPTDHAGSEQIETDPHAGASAIYIQETEITDVSGNFISPMWGVPPTVPAAAVTPVRVFTRNNRGAAPGANPPALYTGFDGDGSWTGHVFSTGSLGGAGLAIPWGPLFDASVISTTWSTDAALPFEVVDEGAGRPTLGGRALEAEQSQQANSNRLRIDGIVNPRSLRVSLATDGAGASSQFRAYLKPMANSRHPLKLDGGAGLQQVVIPLELAGGIPVSGADMTASFQTFDLVPSNLNAAAASIPLIDGSLPSGTYLLTARWDGPGSETILIDDFMIACDDTATGFEFNDPGAGWPNVCQNPPVPGDPAFAGWTVPVPTPVTLAGGAVIDFSAGWQVFGFDERPGTPPHGTPHRLRQGLRIEASSGTATPSSATFTTAIDELESLSFVVGGDREYDAFAEWALIVRVHLRSGNNGPIEVASTIVLNGDVFPSLPAADSVVVLDDSSAPRLRRIELDVPESATAGYVVTFERLERATGWTSTDVYSTYLDDLVLRRR